MEREGKALRGQLGLKLIVCAVRVYVESSLF